MSETTLPSLSSLSPDEALLVDKLCTRFEDAWKNGERPRLEDYRTEVPEAVWPVLFRELLALEVVYRVRRGEQPGLEEYRRRFPEFGEKLAPLLVELLAEQASVVAKQALLPDTLADAAPAPSTLTGAPAIPGHEILGELGKGGMGVVYKAWHQRLKRHVALKMIRPDRPLSTAEEARFRTEAEAIASLQNPHIVQIYDIGEWRPEGGGQPLPYFVLEFCPGGSLANKLAATPQPPTEAAKIVETLARAVQAAHDKNVIHRDLKPANVLLDADGRLKITDFGLAKKLDDDSQTHDGAIMGTPSYMAPEQAAGRTEEVGTAADVYALGAILYECLTGRPPFRGAALLDTLEQVRQREPVPPRELQPKTPRDLETVCLKCLHKERGRRYGSAAELADDLGRFLRREPILARPVGRMERAAKWVRRNPALAFMMATVALILLTATAISTGFGIEAGRQAESAKNSEADAIAKGKELATTNKTLTETVDELETTAACSLLRPFALQGGDQPMSEPEWEALWDLALNRRGRVRYRFVEEASRTPVTSRQLRDRAALALHAAVGLDEQRRAEVEALLVARLDDPTLGDEQKTDLALAASRWDGLTNNGAARTAWQLTRAMRDSKEPRALGALARGLSAVAARLEAADAARAATTLFEVMKDAADPDDLSALREGLSAVAECLSGLAARLEAADAARAATLLLQAIKDAKDPRALWAPARGLSAVAARLEATDAARAATLLLQAIKDAKDPRALSWLAECLSAVAARLEAADAARAAITLVQAIKDAKDKALQALAECLSAVAARLEATDAARAATTLIEVMKDTKNPGALYSLAHGLSAVAARLRAADAATVAAQAANILLQAIKDAKNPQALSSLGYGVLAVAAHLEATDAARAATTLIEAMKDPKHPDALYPLAYALSRVAARLRAADAATVAAQAANILLQAIKDAKYPFVLEALALGLSAVAAHLEAADAARAATTLIEVMKDATDLHALTALAWGLSGLAARLEAADAARAATILLHAMKIDKNAFIMGALASGLSGLAARLEAADAARAATTLIEVIKRATDPDDLGALAKCLSAVEARLQAADAARAAITLIEAIKDTENLDALGALAHGLSVVAARVKAEDAAITVLHAMKKAKDPKTLQQLAQGLSAALSAVPPAEISARSAMAAATVAFPSGTGDPLASLALLLPAAEPPPCRLSTEQLVELLKMPTCIPEARRVVLDQLGNRYRRTFANQWEFVRFAEEQKLGLDFTSPPKRPEALAAGR
jgi:tRNA A-37 threonylcarbamoyl transferase component Bud32